MKEFRKNSSQAGKTYSGSLSLDVNPNVQIKVSSDVVKMIFKQQEETQITLNYSFELKNEYEGDENEPLGLYSYDESKNEFSFTFEEMELLERNKHHYLEFSIPSSSVIEASAELAPIEINGIEGKVVLNNENSSLLIADSKLEGQIENENGLIEIKNSVINLEIQNENGPITIKSCEGNELKVTCENGPIRLNEISFANIEVQSENGPVVCELINVETSNISIKSENGPVKVIIPENIPFNLQAKTENAPIRTKQSSSTGGENCITMNNSDAKVFINIETENGPISVIHDNQLNIKALEKELKKTSEFIVNITKDIDVNELKNNINESVVKIKTMIDTGFDKGKTEFNSHFDKVFSNIDKQDVDDFKKNIIGKKDEMLKSLKTAFSKLKNLEVNVSTPDSSKKKSVNDENKEQSRLKILELLEKGVISAEEAEKLLKAIDA